MRGIVLKRDTKILSTVSIGWRGDTGFSVVGVELGPLHYRAFSYEILTYFRRHKFLQD